MASAIRKGKSARQIAVKTASITKKSAPVASKRNSDAAQNPSARDTGKRHQAIVDALYRLMLRQGYADTSLSELAAEADMSVSHLLYYFPSKEAVLVALCEGIVSRVLARVFPHGAESPKIQIETLVRTRFTDRKETDIWKEVKALASHRPEIHRLLETTFVARHEHFRELFSATPRQPGISADDAAEMAGAFWEGLLDSFQLARLSASDARRLFRTSLYWLAGLQPRKLPPAVKSAKPLKKIA